MKKIKHKELLTFSNLTNLDWHFVELEVENEDILDKKNENNKKGEKNVEYKKLKDLLNPESFVTEYEDPVSGKKKPNYVYGGNDLNDNCNIEKGKAEMRRCAGIAMEYLEKLQEEGNVEGSFLEDWEVVYAADNYKAVYDCLDYLSDGDYDPPSREAVEERKEELKNIQFVVKCVNIGLTVGSVLIPHVVELKAVSKVHDAVDDVTKPLIKKTLIEVVEESLDTFNGQVLKESFETMRDQIISRSKDNPLYPLESTLNEGNVFTLGLIDKVIDMWEKSEAKSKKKAMEILHTELDKYNAEGKIAENGVEITLNHNLSMFDTGFRVLVLKRDDPKEIVIAYKLPDKQRKDKVLPKEFELLDIVYKKICREFKIDNGETEINDKNKDDFYKVRFTGYKGGGDLSLISALQYQKPASVFCITPKKVKGIVDFTHKDLDEDYQSESEITVKTIKEGLRSVAITCVAEVFALSGMGLPISLALVVLGEVFELLIENISREKTEKIYSKLENMGYITNTDDKVTDVIKGYITDTYKERKYEEVSVENGETIRLKKADALKFILQDGELPKITKDEDEEEYYIADTVNSIKNNIMDLSSYDSQAPMNLTNTNEEIKYILKKDIKNGYYKINKKKKISTTSVSAVGSNSSLEHEEKINYHEGQALENLMNALYEIQRGYQNREKEIEIIYYNFEKQSIEVANELLDLSQSGKPYGVTPNEFIFMPYLNKDGYIDNLREDYIISAFKSLVMVYKLGDAAMNFDFREKEMYKKHLYNLKFGLEKELPDCLGHLCDEDKVKDEMLEMAEQMKIINRDDFLPNMFKNRVNYYDQVIKRSKESIEEYYTVEKDITPLFREANHLIKISSDANSRMEYKYNSEDFIVGGPLDILTAFRKTDEEKEALANMPHPSASVVHIAMMLKGKEREQFINRLPDEIKEKYNNFEVESVIYDHTCDFLQADERDLAGFSEDFNLEDALIEENRPRDSYEENGVRFLEHLMDS